MAEPSGDAQHATPSFFQHPWVFGGVLASLAVIGASGVGGYWLSQRGDVNPPRVVSEAWPLTLPDTVDDFSKNPGSGASQTTNSTPPTTTISAIYSKNGQTSVLVLLSRPEVDPEAFLKEAAFTAVQRQDDAFCGTSADNGLDGCVVEQDDTAILAVGMIDQSRDELTEIADTFADALSK